MPGRGETDRAAKRAAIAATYEAKRAAILAGFQGHVEAWKIFEEEVARGVPPMTVMLQAAEATGGGRPMTVEEAEEHRDQLLRGASEDRFHDLQALDLERKLGEDERPEMKTQRDPLPILETADAVRRRVVERASWPEIEKAVDLSHRKVNYIRQALKHDDLGWDEKADWITLGPGTRNTQAGIVLPRR